MVLNEKRLKYTISIRKSWQTKENQEDQNYRLFKHNEKTTPSLALEKKIDDQSAIAFK